MITWTCHYVMLSDGDECPRSTTFNGSPLMRHPAELDKTSYGFNWAESTHWGGEMRRPPGTCYSATEAFT